jgi:hypothetical protein
MPRRTFRRSGRASFKKAVCKQIGSRAAICLRKRQQRAVLAACRDRNAVQWAKRSAETDHHPGITERPGPTSRGGLDHLQQSRVFLQRLQNALVMGFSERGFYEHESFNIADRHLFARELGEHSRPKGG